MKFIRTILSISLISMLSACITQPPAPIEYGSSSGGTKVSSAEAGYYDTPIEEKGKIHEFWGDKDVTETVSREKSEEVKQPDTVINNISEILPQRTSDISHEVIEGEALDSIAKKYDVSKEAIIAKNKLNPPYQLEELQILQIPPQRTANSVEIDDIIQPKHNISKATIQAYRLPVDGKVIAKFGEIYLGSANQGINISASLGADISSLAEGVVMHSDFDAKFGNLVIIKSIDSDIFTAYAHMNDLILKLGENVSAGQVIGHVGQTGQVTAPQLHFAVRKGKVPIDPIAYLEE